MDPPGGGLGEDRAAVGDHEGLVPLEGRVEVGDHPDQPRAGGPVGLEGGGVGLLVARAERAGPAGVLLDLGVAEHEGGGALGASGAHDHPAAGQGIEAELVHLRVAVSSWPSMAVPVCRALLTSCPADAVSCPLCRPAEPPDDRRYTYGTARFAPATSTRRAAGPVGVPLPGRRRRPGRGRGVRMGAVPAPPTPLAGSVATPTGPGYDVVLLGHVGCAVIGLLTVVVSGIQAARLLGAARRGRPVEASLSRYFAPGVNWAGRALYGVPLLGFALIAMSNGSISTGDPWVLTGLVLWAAAAAPGRGGVVAGRTADPGPSGRAARRCGARGPRCPAAGGGRARRRPGGAHGVRIGGRGGRRGAGRHGGDGRPALIDRRAGTRPIGAPASPYDRGVGGDAARRGIGVGGGARRILGRLAPLVALALTAVACAPAAAAGAAAAGAPPSELGQTRTVAVGRDRVLVTLRALRRPRTRAARTGCPQPALGFGPAGRSRRLVAQHRQDARRPVGLHCHPELRRDRVGRGRHRPGDLPAAVAGPRDLSWPGRSAAAGRPSRATPASPGRCGSPSTGRPAPPGRSAERGATHRSPGHRSSGHRSSGPVGPRLRSARKPREGDRRVASRRSTRPTGPGPGRACPGRPVRAGDRRGPPASRPTRWSGPLSRTAVRASSSSEARVPRPGPRATPARRRNQPARAGLAPPVDTATVTGPSRWTEGRMKVQWSASSALLTQTPARLGVAGHRAVHLGAGRWR